MKIFNYLLLTLTLILASCRDDNDGPDPDPNPKETSRTVLIYMVASNTLNSAAVDDLNSIQEAVDNGALQNGRLLIYKVGYLSDPVLQEMTKDGLSTLKTYTGVKSSVTVDAMKQVIADTKRLAPAKDYGAIFWSHSTGWLSPIKVKPTIQRSWGDDKGEKMSIPDMARALEGAGLSFIYFDCCFMGNIETLYELKNSAPYIVASPVEVPSDGMPYEINLKYFFSDKPDLVRIARNTYEHYNALSGSERSCAMSVYSMGAIDDVAAASADILESNHITPEGIKYQQYGFHTSWNNFDGMYYDMGQYFKSLTSDSSLLSAYDDAMESFIVYTAATPMMWGRWELKHTSGVSTFIYSENPSTAQSYAYGDLAWWRDVVEPAFR